MHTQKVTPFLWYEKDAEKAAEFYVSLIPESRITETQETPDGGVFIISFELAGQPFTAINGGPHQTLNSAFSVAVTCDDQAEVDALWSALSEGGQEQQCGWLTDRFGLTWQIVPKAFFDLMQAGTPEQAQRVQAAMMKMVKFDIAALETAFAGETDAR